jgi:hypothetical protein
LKRRKLPFEVSRNTKITKTLKIISRKQMLRRDIVFAGTEEVEATSVVALLLSWGMPPLRARKTAKI